MALLLARDRNPPAVAEGPQAKGFEDERRKWEEERDREKRKLELDRLLIEGQAALAKKDYSAAEKAFSAALKLSPNDGEAVAGLLSARTGLDGADRAREGEAKRKAEVKALLEQGRKALADKRYASAVRAFEAARALAPADPDVLEGLGKARDASDADAAEKKKLADYRKHLDAGKAALEAERFTEAIREFLAAQAVLPGDEEAVNGQREAEKRIAALKDREKREAAFTALLDRARKALGDHRFAEAIGDLEAALRLFPDDREAQRALRDARQALKQAKSDYNKLVAQAETAARLGRLEEAQRLYAEAAKLLPDEPAAARGLREVERLVENARTAQAAYQRYMEQALLAMEALRYADAVAAYNEALRLVPGDIDAAEGLRRARRRMERETRGRAEFDRAMRAATNALARRQFTEAERFFNDALRVLPDDPRATRGLRDARYGRFMLEGQRALAARRKQEAIDAFQSALEEKPGDPVAQDGLRRARMLR
jgi:tetratricopeptide (TPR) repeat protein